MLNLAGSVHLLGQSKTSTTIATGIAITGNNSTIENLKIVNEYTLTNLCGQTGKTYWIINCNNTGITIRDCDIYGASIGLENIGEITINESGNSVSSG